MKKKLKEASIGLVLMIAGITTVVTGFIGKVNSACNIRTVYLEGWPARVLGFILASAGVLIVYKIFTDSDENNKKG